VSLRKQKTESVDASAPGLHQTGVLHDAEKKADFCTARILLQHEELDPNQTDDMDGRLSFMPLATQIQP
jgi:hypothetical protein